MCGYVKSQGTADLRIFQNTLPSRLYWVLFPTDNLRGAIARAKRVLTKEKIDKQMTGQTSSMPFMRVSDGNQSSSRSSKRGVTFDIMDAMERSSDSIDKLTSLVSKMNMEMDKKEAPYKPQIYQSRPGGQGQNRQNRYQPMDRSFSRDRNQIRNRGNYNNRNNYRSDYWDRSRDAYRCDNRRNNYQSNDRLNNYRQGNRRDSYSQDNRRDNYRQDNRRYYRNRQNYVRNNSKQTYRNRSESRESTRNYQNDNSRGRDRSRDRQVQQRTRTL